MNPDITLRGKFNLVNPVLVGGPPAELVTKRTDLEELQDHFVSHLANKVILTNKVKKQYLKTDTGLVNKSGKRRLTFFYKPRCSPLLPFWLLFPRLLHR